MSKIFKPLSTVKILGISFIKGKVSDAFLFLKDAVIFARWPGLLALILSEPAFLVFAIPGG